MRYEDLNFNRMTTNDLRDLLEDKKYELQTARVIYPMYLSEERPYCSIFENHPQVEDLMEQVADLEDEILTRECEDMNFMSDNDTSDMILKSVEDFKRYSLN